MGATGTGFFEPLPNKRDQSESLGPGSGLATISFMGSLVGNKLGLELNPARGLGGMSVTGGLEAPGFLNNFCQNVSLRSIVFLNGDGASLGGFVNTISTRLGAWRASSNSFRSFSR